MSAKILIVNGSLGGSSGNTAQVIQCFEKILRKTSITPAIEVRAIHLSSSLRELLPTPVANLNLHSHGPDMPSLKEAWLQSLEWADALVISTGTYWDSWGSPLQIFLESVTSLEGTHVWLGKPVTCIVTMHSVGGKGVLARLQSVLSSFGALIPPMSGLVYSMVGHEMLKSASRDDSFDHDIWSLDDLEIVADNFLTTVRARLEGHLPFQAWPVDQRDPARRWLNLKSEKTNS